MVSTLMTLLLIGHILGDFYLQPYTVAIGGGCTGKQLLRRSGIYGLAMVFVIIPICNWEWLLWAIGIATLHFAANLLQFRLSKKRDKSENSHGTVFLIDQGIQLAAIVVAAVAIHGSPKPIRYFPFIQPLIDRVFVDISHALSWVVILLIIMKPASAMIKYVLSRYKPAAIAEEKGHPNAGALIGILERGIILLLLSTGQYAAIGFVLTAKSIARYNKIADDPAFAEYYLLGTLLSALVVIAAYLLLF